MAPSKVSFSLLVSSLLLAMLLKKVESQRTYFSINAFPPHSHELNLTYEGDAYVPDSSPILRLAPSSRPHSVGRVLYNTPVNLWDTGTQASFSTAIVLRMSPIDKHNFGNGITFFIVPVNSTLPSGGYGTNLGIYNAVAHGAPIFAFEIDNSRVDLNPDYPHIGININSRRSQNLTRAPWLDTGGVVIARLWYDSRTKTIRASAVYGGSTVWVSFEFNLAAFLPRQVQVGLSASTGAPAVTYMDIFTWQFNSNMVPDVIGARRHNTDVVKQYVE